jgi:steroid delta-isomerase-like uncharacterized protein
MSSGSIGFEELTTNLSVIQRFYEAYNKNDEKMLDEVVADDYIDHGHQPPGRGVEGARNDQREIAAAFPDARFDIDEMIEAEDRVVVRWTLHATHTGPFAGVSPTQKKITVHGISLYRLRNGKIIETRNLADLLGMFTQLGAIEKPKQAA